MNTNLKENLFVGFFALISSATVLNAQIIVSPISYSYSTPPQGDLYNYFDEPHNPPLNPLGQLTDGIKGSNLWYEDLGNGKAYEWVGWFLTNPTITFNFGSQVTINQVQIGFNRSSYGSVALPSAVIIGGVSTVLNGNEIAPSTRGDLNFTGAWHGSSLSVTLDSGFGWDFVDEFKFTTTAVPEISSYSVCVGLGLLGFAGWRRFRIANT